MNKNIIFIMGPGGVGKSTVGPILADKIGYSLIDLDEVHAERHGNITSFVKQHGYELYTQNNTKVLDTVLNKGLHNTIIVLPGGIIGYYPYEKLNALGTCVIMLPSADIEESLELLLDRQSKRDFFVDGDGGREI